MESESSLQGYNSSENRTNEHFEFYHKVLNAPKFVVAPMVDGSDFCFRVLTRKYNAQLAYTPMLFAKLFHELAWYRKRWTYTSPEDRPLVMQFAACNEEDLERAGVLAQSHCDAIDLNLGCPQRCARQGGYGAFLADDTEKVYSMVRRLKAAVSIPVFCKIRVFPDEEKTLEFARTLEQCGCSLLVVHGRTKEQKGRGLPNWALVRKIKEALSIPVIANGGVNEFEQIAECLEATQCDGVMLATALLKNPCLFAGRPVHPCDIMVEYLDICRQHIKPASLTAIRSHTFEVLEDVFVEYPQFRREFDEKSREQAKLEDTIEVLAEFFRSKKLYMESHPKGMNVTNGEITDDEITLITDPNSNDIIVLPCDSTPTEESELKT